VTLPENSPIESLYVVLTGHLAIRVDRGAGPRKVMEWRGGDITGVLPYSRMTASPGETRAEEPTELLDVHRDHFPELIRECHEITAILVHVMIDRARHFTSSDFHDEKILSLGRLSAGLAHELNNPASAVARSARLLTDSLAEAESASRALGAAELSEAQLDAVDRVREVCLAENTKVVRSPVARSDREDEVEAWLERHGANTSAAQSLADSAVTIPALDELAEALDGPALDAALRWVAAGCATRTLSAEIESAATRIHGLVRAVKGFTYMDESAAPMPVDVGRGLADTLTMLRNKARGKSAGVSLDVEPGLPTIQGYGGELNQVWLNLAENALDAVPEAGHVEISACREGDSVVVRVVDDGPGISDDAQERIFDPFFTTKPVGQGTGLGLDIARRLIRRHDGVIDVDSRPGRTEFRVALPIVTRFASPRQEAEQEP
jgi:signal transduction histidine kinase